MCTQCRVLSDTNNLWCQRDPCGSKNAAITLGYGDYVEDIRVVRLLYFLDSSILYLGERGKRRVLIKVAFPGCGQILEREAHTLFSLQADSQPRRFGWLRRRHRYAYLPTLIPAYASTTLTNASCVGNTTFNETHLVYSVFKYEPSLYDDAQLLEDKLLENAQPWYQNAVWMTIALADVLALLHARHITLGNLSPRHVLIRRDRRGVLRPLLISLGLCTPEPRAKDEIRWLHQYADARYLAPELTCLRIDTGSIGRTSRIKPRADTYSLGLILLEILNGQRLFASDGVETADQVRRRILEHAPFALLRPDLDTEYGSALGDTLHLFIQPNPDERPQTAQEFARQLRRVFTKPIPPEVRPVLQAASLGCIALIAVLLAAAFIGVLVVQTL